MTMAAALAMAGVALAIWSVGAVCGWLLRDARFDRPPLPRDAPPRTWGDDGTGWRSDPGSGATYWRHKEDQ